MAIHGFVYHTIPADLIELGELLNKTEDLAEINIAVGLAVRGPLRSAPKITAIWADQAERVVVENREIIDLLNVARGRGKSAYLRKARAKR